MAIARAAAALAACGLLALCANAAPAFAGALEVSNAWARPTAPGSRVGGVYLVIANHASADDRLLAVSSPIAASAQIHQSSLVSGVMQMRAVPFVDCPAGATVSIGPGGLHIMLIDLNTALRAGTAFPLTLQFRDAGRLTVAVSVQAQE